MASGLPLIATRLALRGWGTARLTLEGVVVADAPEDFAPRARRGGSGAGVERDATPRQRRQGYYDAILGGGLRTEFGKAGRAAAGVRISPFSRAGEPTRGGVAER